MIKLGQHPHQFPAQREEQLLQLRLRSVTVLDLDAGWYIPKLDQGDTEFTVRLYHSNMPSRVPEEIAGAVIVEAEKWRARLGDRLIMQPVNEINLGIEWGGDHGLQSWLETDDGFARRADIHMRIAKSLRARAPWLKHAGPFDSPGHQDVDGRVEIRKLCEMGYCDLIDAFGYHAYAEGLDRGGYDAEDKEWYSDRVLKARQILDECGYEHLPIIIGETNRKDADQGDIWGELGRYMQRLEGKVDRLDWFVWSSPDASFGSMQMWKCANPVANFNRLAAGGAEAIPPAISSGIACFDGNGNPTNYEYLSTKYAIKATHGVGIGVTQIREDTSGTMELKAFAPADQIVSIRTADGNWGREAYGATSMVMGGGNSSAVWPPTPGPWNASCRGAKVEGLGWLGHTEHHKLEVTFGPILLKPIEPLPPEPVTPPVTPIPPVSPYQPEGAFAQAYQKFWGACWGPAHYPMLDPGPPEYRPAAQHFEKGVAVWTGSNVRFIARGT